MTPKARTLKWLLFSTVVVLATHSATAEMRTWTAASGATMEAEFRGMENGRVMLRSADGRTVGILPENLSALDREYLRQNLDNEDQETAEAEEEPDNLLDNGDFNSGKSRWSFDNNMDVIEAVETAADGKEEVNQILSVELDSRRTRTLEQRLNTDRGIRSLRLTFRVRAGKSFNSGGTPPEHYVLVFSDDGSRTRTFQPRRVRKVGEWEEVEWVYTKRSQRKRVDFSVEIQPGEGYLYFDDFKIVDISD